MKIPNNTKHTKIKQKLHAHTPKQTTPPQKNQPKAKPKKNMGGHYYFYQLFLGLP